MYIYLPSLAYCTLPTGEWASPSPGLWEDNWPPGCLTGARDWVVIKEFEALGCHWEGVVAVGMGADGSHCEVIWFF